MRLASHLRKSLEEIRSLSSEEVSLWMAFDKIIPLSDSWAETGTVCSTFANLWSSKRFYPEDFIPVEQRNNEEDFDGQLMILDGLIAKQAKTPPTRS